MSGEKLGVSLHTFPKDLDIRRIWVNFVKVSHPTFIEPRLNARHIRVCSAHFTEDQFMQRLFYPKSRRRLKPFAYPSIHTHPTDHEPDINILHGPGQYSSKGDLVPLESDWESLFEPLHSLAVNVPEIPQQEQTSLNTSSNKSLDAIKKIIQELKNVTTGNLKATEAIAEFEKWADEIIFQPELSLRLPADVAGRKEAQPTPNQLSSHRIVQLPPVSSLKLPSPSGLLSHPSSMTRQQYAGCLPPANRVQFSQTERRHTHKVLHKGSWARPRKAVKSTLTDPWYPEVTILSTVQPRKRSRLELLNKSDPPPMEQVGPSVTIVVVSSDITGDCSNRFLEKRAVPSNLFPVNHSDNLQSEKGNVQQNELSQFRELIIANGITIKNEGKEQTEDTIGKDDNCNICDGDDNRKGKYEGVKEGETEKQDNDEYCSDSQISESNSSDEGGNRVRRYKSDGSWHPTSSENEINGDKNSSASDEDYHPTPKRRRRNKHKTNYQCDKCGAMFLNTKFNIHKHLLKEHGVNSGLIEEFTCNICGRGQWSLRSLELHVLRHSDDKPYECQKCEKQFVSIGELGRHKYFHKTCGNSNRKRRLKSHECSFCKMSFLASEKLERHLLTHTGQKPYLCIQCGMLFNQPFNLVVHIRSHSKGTLSLKCCRQCGEEFPDCPEKLAEHIVDVHMATTPYRCVSCGHLFKEEHQFAWHMKNHKKIKVL